MAPAIHDWLVSFGLDEFLHREVAGVIGTLPGHVRDDFLDDPAFTLFDYEPHPGLTMHVPVRLPRGYSGSGGRSVVLKRTLTRRPLPFVRYVIAHELAHAHLRNAGRFPGEDPEHAADALAAEWGFPKPY
jgi:hypothetical protein